MAVGSEARLPKFGSWLSDHGQVNSASLSLTLFKALLYLKRLFFWWGWVAALQGMRDLSSPTRDQTCARCGGSAVLTAGRPGNSQKRFLQ